MLGFYRLIFTFALLMLCSLSFAEREVISGSDPLEKMNRAVFVFNEGFDKYAFRPTAVAYQFITPEPIDKGISNFFTTVADVPDFANALMQGKFKKSGISISRFFINLTLGFFGLFDVAKDFGLPNQEEDFGQTLASWGVPSGPYLVLPFLGSSNIRDGLGLIPDVYMSPLYIDNVSARNTTVAVKFIDLRADLIDYEGLVTGDRYIFFRDAYMQRREFLIKEGVVEDNFGDSIEEGADWLDEGFIEE